MAPGVHQIREPNMGRILTSGRTSTQMPYTSLSVGLPSAGLLRIENMNTSEYTRPTTRSLALNLSSSWRAATARSIAGDPSFDSCGLRSRCGKSCRLTRFDAPQPSADLMCYVLISVDVACASVRAGTRNLGWRLKIPSSSSVQLRHSWRRERGQPLRRVHGQ